MIFFNNPFRGPLTADDVFFIEQSMDDLTCRLLPEGRYRQNALALALPEKIEEYIDMADHAEKGLKLGLGPELGQNLRDLLRHVNGYYYQLN